MSGGPRGERPSKEFLNFLTKFKKQKTHAFSRNMGNTKYEHVVSSVHKINNEEVTTDTPLDFIEPFLEDPGAFNERATTFNNQLLSSTVDDFFFPELFEFLELEEATSSQKSDQSNFSHNH